MTSAGYTIELIKDQTALGRLAERLTKVSVFSIDIETTEWWNRHRERVALIQIAYPFESKIKVAVIDALAGLNPESLRFPVEAESITKVIHNAAFDATRLAKHYKFTVAPVFDTMLAARRNREPKYFLQAQARQHLNIQLEKGSQRSDWSRRPLDAKQIAYAALDAAATLQLYLNQTERNLNGIYRSKNFSDPAQIDLPLAAAHHSLKVPATTEAAGNPPQFSPTPSAVALLGIISKLPGRYGPEQLTVSVGADRVGLAGWIVDQTLGRETDFDEREARTEIANLFESALIQLSDMGRLESTAQGEEIWSVLKTI